MDREAGWGATGGDPAAGEGAACDGAAFTSMFRASDTRTAPRDGRTVGAAP